MTSCLINTPKSKETDFNDIYQKRHICRINGDWITSST